MNKSRFYYLMGSFFCLIFSISCVNSNSDSEFLLSLKLAGKNKLELQKVLEYYTAPKDSLKLKAAIYLITNMKYHSYIDYGNIYEPAFKKAAVVRKKIRKKSPNIKASTLGKKVNKIFAGTIDSIRRDSGFIEYRKRVFDLEEIHANEFIENIEIAFEAYAKNPLKLCNSFEDFLEYVLPYRVLNEPLEQGKRKELFEKYKWALDSLEQRSLNDVVEKIYNDVKLYGGLWGKKYKYPGVPSLSEIEATGFGDCTYISSYFVNVLRSIGIPSGIDYCPRWGVNAVAGRHHWPFYIKRKGFRSLDMGTDRIRDLNKIYKISGLPKIFRMSFSKKNEKDMTGQYHNTHNFKIKNIWGIENLNIKNVYLGVFSPKNGWDKIVSASSIEEGFVYFKNMADNMIYAVVANSDTGDVLVNYPFELQKSGVVKFFKKGKGTIGIGMVTRKYPPFRMRWSKAKIKRIKSLNGCILQGANKNSSNEFIDLYKIENFYSTQNIKFRFQKTENYKYYRLKGVKNKIIYLANFGLLDANGKVLDNWSNIELANGKPKDLNRIIDDKAQTYLSKKDFSLLYTFDNAQVISGFQIQARNDGNHIDIGDNYELFYWDKDWLSLGERTANDTLLEYQNIPRNTLYWLKNYTKGKEEFVFSFDEQGKQVWTGISEYEFIDLDTLYKSFD